MEARERKTETAETGSAEMEDRLSSLPDEILVLILQFLDTKHAAQTSVLSRRWKNMWSQLPIINIDSDSFRYYLSFRNFVLNVISRRVAPVYICKFWFDISNPIYSSLQMCIDSHDLFEPLVQRVIHHVVTHGVRYLCLHFPRIVDDLPILFTCPSLKMLELRELIIPPTQKLDFPTLTTLNLVKCTFILEGKREGNGAFGPFSGCLCLKSLFICDCRIPSKVKIFEISAPELTTLKISRMQHYRNINPKCKVVISSTKITSFVFIDSHVLEFSFVGLPLLKSVDIDAVVADYLYGAKVETKREFSVHLVDMFGAMGNAETVTLSFDTLHFLSIFVDLLGRTTPFTGMKVLKVKVPHVLCSFSTGVEEVINILMGGSHAKDLVVEYLKQAPSGIIRLR
ncbi:hypothetical protein L6164_032468 [Bauhinia variegata]|uniref:Uncharacterized protein n=1 Tax=Bauhinia variegata TaxID=167791 RepID=A0ACB9KNY6_BAUVA|nr:hypothetical protein L6164_032468 [Bauhinia variegata]